MKKIITLILLTGALHLNAATVRFSLADFTGGPNNRAIIIALRSQTGQSGTNIVTGTPRTIQPTNGVATVSLLSAVYTVQIDGINKLFYMPVPDTTNTYNALDLVNQGISMDAPYPAFAAGTNILILTNWVAGKPVLTISSQATNSQGLSTEEVQAIAQGYQTELIDDLGTASWVSTNNWIPTNAGTAWDLQVSGTLQGIDAGTGFGDPLTIRAGSGDDGGELHLTGGAGAGGNGGNVIISGGTGGASNGQVTIGNVTFTGTATFDSAPSGSGASLTDLDGANIQADTIESNKFTTATRALLGGGSVPDGIITNNQSTAVALTNAGNQITGTFTGDGMKRPETYGGRGDGKRLFDAELTISSTTLTAPSGTFSSADIGKVAIVYLDSTNVTFIVTGIAGVTSATEITLSNAASASASSMTVVYGTDNTAAISNAVHAAWAGGGGVVQFKNGIYLAAGTPVQQDALVNGVIRLPTSFIRGSVLYTNITVEFRGTVPPVLVYSSQSPPAPINGSIIYTISAPDEFSRANALFSHSYAGDYSLEQYVFRNLLFRQPMGGNRLWDIYARNGGGLILEDVMFDTEFPTNYLANGALRRFSPTNTVQNAASPGAVWFPGTSNDANSRINRFGVMGRGGGIRAGEHLRMANGVFEYGGTGVGLDIASTYSGPVIEGVQFLCMDYPFHVLVPGGNNNQVLNARGLEFEGHGLTKAHIYDLSNTLSGIFTWRNDEPLTNTIETKLTMVNENQGAWHFGNSKYKGGITVDGVLASELGADPLLNGLLFDVNFSESTNYTWIYNRAPAPMHRVTFGTEVGNPGPKIRTNTPAGIGLYANSQGYLWATNSFPNVTNFTMSAVFRSTAGNIQYPILFSASNSAVLYFGNGTQLGWRTKNNVGTQVTVVPDVAPNGLSDGRWHQMVGTYDGATMLLYVDGLLVGSGTQTNGLLLSTDTLLIGNQTGGAFTLAKPRIWSRVLGPDEIFTMALQDLGPQRVSLRNVPMATNALLSTTLDMDVGRARTNMIANVTIAGVLNCPANSVKSTTIQLIGNASAPYTVTVPTAFVTSDGLRVWTVTNAQRGELWVEVWGAVSTNAVFRNLW